MSDSCLILCHTGVGLEHETSAPSAAGAQLASGMSDSVSDLSGGATQAPERQREKEGRGTGEAEGAL